MHILHLRNHQVPLAEVRSDLQLIGTGSSTQNTTRQVNCRQWQLSQQRCCNIHLPPSRLHLDNASNDQITYFWGIPGP